MSETAGMVAKPQGRMWTINWKGKAGKVPASCEGLFSSQSIAEELIRIHYEGLQNKVEANAAKKKRTLK